MTTNGNKKETSRECLCGCGAVPKKGRYIPGHDAKHKKALIDAAISGSRRCVAKLEELGWGRFLEAKREKLAKWQGSKPVAAPDSTSELEPRRRGGRRKRTEEAVPSTVSEQFQASAIEENPGDSTPAS